MENVGFGPRLGAIILDIIIFAIPMSIIFTILFGLEAMAESNPGVMFLWVVLWIAYLVLQWTYTDGATLGKKIVKIKIVKDDGSPVDLGTACLRYVGYILSNLPCCLGFLWVLWDKDKKGWHDKIAGTKVIQA